jgi:hypothetical protein
MRLNWDLSGQRFYEVGIDRGVLFVDAAAGVPWVGLISVSESPSGGTPQPYYIDGLKYLNISSAEEFEATIEAYSSPHEFGPCDGTVAIQNGLYVTQQPRKQFSFSYRSKVGNDTQSEDHGYKIHIVYNALAAPSQRTNKTINDSVDVINLSWSITTLSPPISGFKPTAHMVIDSRYSDPTALSTVEDILYGSDSLTSSLPTPDDLIDIFNA